MKVCYVYIMASSTGTLYTGITSNLVRRVIQHQDHLIPGFTSRYNVNKLLYYETFNTPKEAIRREKQIKGWRREKKVRLIESKNPNWLDLSQAWYAFERKLIKRKDKNRFLGSGLKALRSE